MPLTVYALCKPGRAGKDTESKVPKEKRKSVPNLWKVDKDEGEAGGFRSTSTRAHATARPSGPHTGCPPQTWLTAMEATGPGAASKFPASQGHPWDLSAAQVGNFTGRWASPEASPM